MRKPAPGAIELWIDANRCPRDCHTPLLGVSTATVYKAVARGELAHVRVSSVIRIRLGSGQA